MITEKTISEFLENEYKEFAMYTIESRAIPSCIDGLKSSSRKVIHACTQIWKTGNEKTLKVFQLSGWVANKCYYHHGDCLDGETKILLNDGSYIQIKDWFDKFNDNELCVVSYDEETKEFTSSIGHSPRIGSVTNIEYEIEMEDGNVFKCTNNHPFLTKRGWVTAENLLESDDIISFKP